jgi:hypothetical protein
MRARRESRLRSFAAKLRGCVRGHRDGDEFDSEVREHVRLLTERFVAQGLSVPGIHAECVPLGAEVIDVIAKRRHTQAMKVFSYLLALIAAALCAGCGATSSYQGSSSGASAEAKTPEDRKSRAHGA